jgi:hypothetical protein
MSFEVQEGASTCGIASLRYAFSLLGAGFRRNEELEEDDVRRRIGKNSWKVFHEGVQEEELKRGAAKLGLTMRIHRVYKRDPDGVIERLREATQNGHPCIVCVHDDDELFFHWICVAGFSGDWALVFDPATLDDDMSEATYWLADDDHTVDFAPGLMKVSRLRAWIDTTDDHQEEIDEEYGGEHHTFLEVAVAAERRREFVPGMADEGLVRRMRRDLDLAISFDQYIDDLKDIFGVPAWNGEASGTPAWRWLEKNRDRIDDLFSTWTLSDACERSVIDEEFENLLAITRCYGFRARDGEDERVWANLAFYLGWFACSAAYDVEKFED